MRKFRILIPALALAATAPLAAADTAQLELLPRVGGAELTTYVPPQIENPAPLAGGTAQVGDTFFYRHTGGVPPL